MLQKDPRARIKLDDINKHPFVSEGPTKSTLSSLQVLLLHITYYDYTTYGIFLVP